MRQFYETYRADKKVASLLRQLPWTHHLMILGRSRFPEEREFYMRVAIREHWRTEKGASMPTDFQFSADALQR